MTSEILRLSPVVSLCLKTGLVMLAAGLNELAVFLEVAALQGHMVAAIAESEVRTAVYEGGI